MNEREEREGWRDAGRQGGLEGWGKTGKDRGMEEGREEWRKTGKDEGMEKEEEGERKIECQKKE